MAKRYLIARDFKSFKIQLSHCWYGISHGRGFLWIYQCHEPIDNRIFIYLAAKGFFDKLKIKFD